MGKVHETVKIDAPIEVVWAILSDYGGIASWNPLLKSSRVIGTATQGIGAVRHCEIDPRGYTRERVLAWEPGASYTWEVYETDMPMKHATNRFALRTEGRSTIATMEMDYALKGGFLGRILDRAMANAKMRGATRETLRGLKARAEARPVQSAPEDVDSIARVG